MDAMSKRKQLGRAVRDGRLAKGCSQVELALMIGSGPAQIHNVEAGGANIGIDTYLKIDEVLELGLFTLSFES